MGENIFRREDSRELTCNSIIILRIHRKNALGPFLGNELMTRSSGQPSKLQAS